MNGYARPAGLYVDAGRTRPLSPSKLTTFLLCPLRYVLETERPKEGSIPSGPMALRGTAAHNVIQLYAGRPLPSGTEIRNTFLNAVIAAASRPDGNALIRMAVERDGASAIFAQDQIVAAVQFIRKVLTRHLDNVTLHDPGRWESCALPISGRRQPSFGIERKLSSIELDMEGRVDLLYKDDAGTVHVADFKTGKVLDVGGEPNSSYLMQVSAYGVLAQETLQPEKMVLELFGPSSEWTGPLNQELVENVKALVARLRARLPKNTPKSALTLAEPGVHCHGCSYRPSCPAYISILDSAVPDGGLISPFDLSGVVMEATQHGDLSTIRARTKNQAVIALNGVPTSIYPGLEAGTKIHAFSLGTFDALSRTSFAANFFVYRNDKPKASAFASLIKKISS